MAKVDIFAPGFSIKTSKPTSEKLDEAVGVHYRGIIKGNDHSLAAISVFKNEVMGFYSTDAEGNVTLGRLGGNNPTNRHILYAVKDLKISSDFYCDTKDDGVVLPESVLQEPEEIIARCIKIYLEGNYDLFLNKGSVNNVGSYIAGLFNQSAALFANEGVAVAISEITVWNSPSPYTGNSSLDVLEQFRTIRTTFNGDLAHLITLDRNFGGIAYRPALCNRSVSYAVSDVDANFANVPTYSWSVYVFTHETGHNLGSHHTHACVWNGNGTAIDGCGQQAGFPEGSCSTAPLPPQNGGTIMSYCHFFQQTAGINFNLGFGTQPRNVILNSFNSAACLTDCGGGGCSATPISVGQTVNNSLTSADCAYTGSTRYYDDYVFNGTAGQQISVSMSSTFDTYLYLVNSSNQIVAEDDDGGDGTNSRIPSISGFFTLPATGSYIIRATSYSAGSVGAYTLNLFGVTAVTRKPFDFDGDSKTDISIFRPSNGQWWYQSSSNGSNYAAQFGTSTDRLVPADYTGDGKADFAFWQPSTGQWFITSSRRSFLLCLPVRHKWRYSRARRF